MAEMAKEFSLDDADFAKKEEKDLEELPEIRPSATVAVESMGFFEGTDRQEDAESAVMDCEDDGDQEEEETPTVKGKKKKTVRFGAAEAKTDVKVSTAKLNGSSKKDGKAQSKKEKANPELSLPGNQRSNKFQRLQMKKAKKEHSRRGKMQLVTHPLLLI